MYVSDKTGKTCISKMHEDININKDLGSLDQIVIPVSISSVSVTGYK